jgi:hypothetical protein
MTVHNEITPEVLERLKLDHRLNVGAGWFFWVAGLTLLSSLITLIGNEPFGFIIGLGVTQMIDSLQSSWVALGFDVLAASLFIFLGLKARQAQRSAFMLGILLYGLDSLVFIAVKDYVGLIFHAFVLLGLLGGLQAIHQMQHVSHTDSAYQG